MLKSFFARSVLVLSLMAPTAALAAEAAFDIHLIPAGDFTGRTTEVAGFATMDGAKVKVENIKVTLKNIKTGVELRDSHTRKHLEVEKFPDAILVKGEGENGKGTGTLRIKGIDKPVAGTYKIMGSDLVAQFKIKLSDYKITGIKYMGIGVDDEVNLTVKLPIKKGK